MFIFRNYTIENLFDEDVRFSGYGDISVVPEDTTYVWLYTAPVALSTEDKLAEVQGLADKLRLVADRIPASTPFYIFTLCDVFPVKICETDFRLADSIRAFNDTVRQLAESHPNVRMVDFGEFLQEFKPSEWINWRFYFFSQMVISPSLAPAFKTWWSHKQEALLKPRKKCLVLDLDNTLWQGVLGEDGISGIKMSGDYPGNVFMYFQEGLVSLSQNGIILTICSKNNEDDVQELWQKNPFVKLKPEHIAAHRINWQNKADNIRELARELNIGLDSMVFIDDNPSERELVKQQLPMVEVPEFPQKPYELPAFYKRLVLDYFQTYRLTSEDLDKTEQYKANARRASEQAHFTNLDDFIRSLDIHIEVQKADEFNIPRIAQMTQKTNQFNLTTQRYSEADILTFVSEGNAIYCISVSDRFGDNGITGAIIVKESESVAHIDNLLLSCRILGKNIETAFVCTILNILHDKGVRTVTAQYIPTLKNGQVADFYDTLGFCQENIHNEDGKSYRFDLSKKFIISDLYNITIK